MVRTDQVDQAIRELYPDPVIKRFDPRFTYVIKDGPRSEKLAALMEKYIDAHLRKVNEQIEREIWLGRWYEE